MQIINYPDRFHSAHPLVLSLGMFDGVHKGHQCILNEINHIAENKNLKSAILTFWPHPRLVLQPETELKLLSTIDEKTQHLLKQNLDYLFLQPFNEAFRNLTGEEFVEQILVGKLNVKHLIIGHDHVFGKNKSGNFELLKTLAPKFGFEVERMDAVNLHNDHISSTKIRTALTNGQIASANEMLGYPYAISGTVIHGQKLGRTLGFPTANLQTDPVKLLPKKGAYIVEVQWREHSYKGMLSIGTNPTVNGKKTTVEVHLLNFEGNLYDETLTVKFRAFLHEEIKFDTLEALIERLKEDQKQTEDYFAQNPLRA
ncbi:bifunctional riboflavin kinase/FAD synthetase [Bergeyella sp. RCAD1439]|uniref:bifunctional riboflavin kinase/FAD synthetase n=1 Tax=Bergeyella anatis TaxID=3113737 RepID=UPI002E172E84|nr:bifunctional riboflavin kinase/FAD synthetase [Bergeyella sp. RCAD1439]